METVLIIIAALIVFLLVLLGSLFLLAKYKPATVERLASSKLGMKLIGFMLKSDKIKEKSIDIAAEQISADPEMFKQTATEQLNLGREQTRKLDKHLESMDSDQLAKALKQAEKGAPLNPQSLLTKQATPDQQRAKAKKKAKQRAKAKAARKQRRRR